MIIVCENGAETEAIEKAFFNRETICLKVQECRLNLGPIPLPGAYVKVGHLSAKVIMIADQPKQEELPPIGADW